MSTPWQSLSLLLNEPVSLRRLARAAEPIPFLTIGRCGMVLAEQIPLNSLIEPLKKAPGWAFIGSVALRSLMACSRLALACPPLAGSYRASIRRNASHLSRVLLSGPDPFGKIGSMGCAVSAILGAARTSISPHLGTNLGARRDDVQIIQRNINALIAYVGGC